MLRQLIAWLARALATEKTPGHVLDPRTVAPQGVRPAVDHQKAIDLIGQIGELAWIMSEHVGVHSGNLGALNQELSGVRQGDTLAVADIVGRLLIANGELHRRLEEAEAKLQAQHRQLQNVVNVARTDSLTGLLNRRCFDEELGRCLTTFLRGGRPSSLVMLDIDHFKSINDRFGHVAGDLVLKHVAGTLAGRFRDTDVVARFGGEEFAVIMPGVPCQQASERMELARSAISQTSVEFEGRTLRVTASAGVAQTAASDSAVTLLARADAALYAAKRHGRDCGYWFDGEQNRLVELAAPEAAAPCADPAEKPVPRLDDEQAQLELAHEQFADASFVPSVARRIAEWRRGGSTFSVILARLDARDPTAAESPVRAEATRLVFKLLPRSLRDMDQLTRWRSDGLAVLLPAAPATDAARVARRMAAALKTLRLPQGPAGTRVSISVGIAEGIEGNDAYRVLHRAWKALHAALADGPGGIYLHDGLKVCPCAGASVSR